MFAARRGRIHDHVERVGDNMRRTFVIGCCAWALMHALLGATATADPIEDFYKGKSLRMIVGSPPGATYDIWARLVARHLGKHIPGNPALVVQNMQGAGGTTATNYAYNVASQDGTVVTLVGNTIPFEPMLGVPQTKFDALKLNWLGSPGQDTAVTMVWHTVPVASIADARTHKVKFAATSLNGTAAFYVRIFNDVFKTRFTLVFGYPGLTEAVLAMERGEVDGHPSPYWSYLKSAKPDWIKEKKIKFLLQFGRVRNPELPDVPFAHDLATNDADRAVLDAAVAPLAMGLPFFLGPDVPAERVAAMRRAFSDTFKDQEFLAEAKKQNLDIAPITAEEAQKTVVDTYNMSKPVVDRLRRLYEAGEQKK
jgi:tripartite-type tricarboxylate transporter receptor subunit TctC